MLLLLLLLLFTFVSKVACRRKPFICGKSWQQVRRSFEGFLVWFLSVASASVIFKTTWRWVLWVRIYRWHVQSWPNSTHQQEAVMSRVTWRQCRDTISVIVFWFAGASAEFLMCFSKTFSVLFCAFTLTTQEQTARSNNATFVACVFISACDVLLEQKHVLMSDDVHQYCTFEFIYRSTALQL